MPALPCSSLASIEIAGLLLTPFPLSLPELCTRRPVYSHRRHNSSRYRKKYNATFSLQENLLKIRIAPCHTQQKLLIMHYFWPVIFLPSQKLPKVLFCSFNRLSFHMRCQMPFSMPFSSPQKGVLQCCRVGPIALSAEIFGLISCLIFGRKL